VSAAVVEHQAIELLNLFKEMFLDGKFEVAPAIIVATAPDGEDAARLLFQARPDKGSAGERLLVGGAELFDVVRNTVKKTEILALIKNPAEGLFNEIGCILDSARILLRAGPSN
jgi:hypothetical protein